MLLKILLLLWPKLELATPSEVKVMKLELQNIAAIKRSQRCPRPGLWDEPQLPGEAEIAMHALLKGSGGLLSCLKMGKRLKDELHEENGEARTLDAPVALSEEIKAMESACTQLPQALHQAISHEGGCSPYLIGRRPIPKPLRALDLSKAVVVIARKRAREGAASEGMRWLLEAIRFNQDLMRGGVPFLFPMSAVVGDKLLISTAKRLLDASSPEPVVSALTRILEADPHPHEFFKTDATHMAYYDLLPALERGPRSNLGEGLPDELGLALIAIKESTQLWLKACPQASSLKACARGIEALNVMLETQAQERSAWKSALQIALGGREALRQEAIETFKQLLIPSLKHFVQRYAYRRALITTLRYRAMVKAAQGRCLPFPQAEGLRFLQEEGAALIQSDEFFGKDKFLKRIGRINERVICTAP